MAQAQLLLLSPLRALLTICCPLWFSADGQKEVNPDCLWVSEGHFEACCCERDNDCWGGPDNYNGAMQRAACCEPLLWKCPLGSSALAADAQVSAVQVKGVGTVYIFNGGTMASYQGILNCDHSDEWRHFRALLIRHDVKSLAETAPLDHELMSKAEELFERFNLSAHPLGLSDRARFAGKEMFDLFNGHLTLRANGDFCFFGYVSAAFLVALRLQGGQDARGLEKRDAESSEGGKAGAAAAAEVVLRDAHRLFEGNGRPFDVLSSTGWPLGPWDLLVNVGRGRPVRLTTLAGFLVSAEGPLAPRVRPLLFSAARRGAALASRGRRLGPAFARKVSAAVFVDHPALDLELPSLLLLAFPGALRVTFVCSDTRSSYTAKTARESFCESFPLYCAPPHSAVTMPGPREAWPGEPAPQPVPQADLLLCSWYTHCAGLEGRFGGRVPIVSYYGGYPLNDFHIRSGSSTIGQHFAALRSYVTSARDSGTPAPALLLADAPYTAEFVHSFTGIRLPVYRPLSSYISASYAPVWNHTFLIPMSSSSTTLTKSHLLLHFLHMFSGLSESPRVKMQNGFLSFQEFASYRGIVYWPGPHSWVLMQFRELFNMAVPLFVPRKEDFIRFGTEWVDKLGANLHYQAPENWLPQEKYWEAAHPFSPWIGGYDMTSEYIAAALYWTQWLETFTWPHVQLFHGVPHLLLLLQTTDFRAVSAGMSDFNRAARWRAIDFWSGALPGLLHAVPRTLELPPLEAAGLFQ